METQNQNQDKVKATRKAGGVLFTGCMFIGMGAGWYFGHLNAGLFAGMGVGFIFMAVVLLSAANKK
jgi:hypothetical protein